MRYIKVSSPTDERKVLSVIIPAYNVERTLSDAVDSLLVDEILDRLDIIIVNDGSTDSTQIIAEKYARDYPQSIRVINKENGGHGSTINVGISLSKGKYIRILDGDDSLNSEELCRFVNDMMDLNVDLVITGFVRHDIMSGSDNRRGNYKYVHKKIYSFDSICHDIEYIAFHSVIYNRDIFLDNRVLALHENCYYVDQEYIFYPIPFVQYIAFWEGELYIYRTGNIGQSVSDIGYRKNKGHQQKVALSIAEYLSNYRDVISCEKYSYLERSAVNVAHDVLMISFRVYAAKDALSSFSQFDKRLKEKNEEVYIALGEKVKMISLLRHTGYSLAFGYACYFARKIQVKMAVRTRLRKLLNL